MRAGACSAAAGKRGRGGPVAGRRLPGGGRGSAAQAARPPSPGCAGEGSERAAPRRGSEPRAGTEWFAERLGAGRAPGRAPRWRGATTRRPRCRRAGRAAGPRPGPAGATCLPEAGVRRGEAAARAGERGSSRAARGGLGAGGRKAETGRRGVRGEQKRWRASAGVLGSALAPVGMGGERRVGSFKETRL